MSTRLTGRNPLSYLGVDPTMPPNMFMETFPPTPTDSRNVNVGDFWVDRTAHNLYVLVSLAGGNADWILIETSSGGPSINQINGSSGTVLPIANVVNITGGNNITTTGSGNTLTLDLTGTTNHALQIGNSTGSLTSLGVATNGQIPIGSTGADPVLATITAGPGISVTNGAGSITLSASGTVAETYTADAGVATPSLNNINIVGDGSTISTLGSGSTITISAEGSVATTFQGDSGTATPSANVMRFLGGTGIMTAASGNTVVITNTGSGAGGAGAMTLIGSATASSQTSVTFTSGINGTFDNYILYFDSVLATSTGSSFYLITQLSTNGGSSYITTGYLNQAPTGITSGLIAAQYVTSNPAGTEVASGFQNLLDLTANAANHFPASESNFMVWDGAASATSGSDLTGIYPVSPTDVDAIKVLLSNGGTFSGTFYLYGLSNTGGSSGGSAVTFIQNQTATSQTALDFTTGITGSINDYLLVFDSVELATTGSDLFLEVQVSTNGGSSYITTGYVNNGANTDGMDIAKITSSFGGPTAIATGEAFLQDFTSGGAADFPTSVANANTWDFTAGTASRDSTSGLLNTASTVVNAFRVRLSNGAAFSGKFSLFGYSSSGSSGTSGTQNFITDSGTATQSGGNITIHGTGGVTTSGAGSTVTITGSGTGISWTTVTAATQTLAGQHGYVINRATLVTLTLPVTATVGDIIYITGLGAGGWTIAQNSGQLIHFGSAVTTTGAGGSLSSTNQFDTITLVCSVTNTTFNVLSSIGNITFV